MTGSVRNGNLLFSKLRFRSLNGPILIDEDKSVTIAKRQLKGLGQAFLSILPLYKR